MTQISFLQFWTLKSKIQALADLISCDGPLPCAYTGSSGCPYMAEGTRELTGIPSIRALIPSMGAPSSRLNYLPKAAPTNAIMLRVSF